MQCFNRPGQVSRIMLILPFLGIPWASFRRSSILMCSARLRIGSKDSHPVTIGGCSGRRCSQDGASRKDVPLDTQLAESLEAWKKTSCYTNSSDWVFASPHVKGRQPYWPSTLWRYYGKPGLRAGITKQVSYHTFRHTFGTLLNANGENPKVVQELLRHASLKVTTECVHAGC